jgi:hypothetical protein
MSRSFASFAARDLLTPATTPGSLSTEQPLLPVQQLLKNPVYYYVQLLRETVSSLAELTPYGEYLFYPDFRGMLSRDGRLLRFTIIRTCT